MLSVIKYHCGHLRYNNVPYRQAVQQIWHQILCHKRLRHNLPAVPVGERAGPDEHTEIHSVQHAYIQQLFDAVLDQNCHASHDKPLAREG